MISPQIAQLLIHTIILEKLATTAASGDKDYGVDAGVEVKARVEHQTRLVRDASGREVASQTFIIAKPVDVDGNPVTFEASDRITLPDGFTPAQPTMHSITRVDDATGIDHWEIRA